MLDASEPAPEVAADHDDGRRRTECDRQPLSSRLTALRWRGPMLRRIHSGEPQLRPLARRTEPQQRGVEERVKCDAGHFGG